MLFRSIGNTVCGKNRVIVSAPTSKLTGTTLAINNNSRLIFNIPEAEGFANGVGGASVATFSGAVTLDATSSIEINAGKFIGKALLLKASVLNGVSIPDDITVNIGPGNTYNFTKSPNNDFIEINCSPKGTLLIVR